MSALMNGLTVTDLFWREQSGNAVTPPAARDLGAAVAEYLLEVAA